MKVYGILVILATLLEIQAANFGHRLTPAQEKKLRNKLKKINAKNRQELGLNQEQINKIDHLQKIQKLQQPIEIQKKRLLLTRNKKLNFKKEMRKLVSKDNSRPYEYLSKSLTPEKILGKINSKLNKVRLVQERGLEQTPVQQQTQPTPNVQQVDPANSQATKNRRNHEKFKVKALDKIKKLTENLEAELAAMKAAVEAQMSDLAIPPKKQKQFFKHFD